jgi:hypothetical protein
MVAQVLGDDAARDFEWDDQIAVEGGLHHRELVFVVQEELLYAPVQVVEERVCTSERRGPIPARAALSASRGSAPGAAGPCRSTGRCLG